MSLSSLAILCLLNWPGGFHPAVGVARDVSNDQMPPAAIATILGAAPLAARDPNAPERPHLWSPESLISGEDSSDGERAFGDLATPGPGILPTLSVALNFAVSHLADSRRTSRSPILRC